jgi:hypothetical protein
MINEKKLVLHRELRQFPEHDMNVFSCYATTHPFDLPQMIVKMKLLWNLVLQDLKLILRLPQKSNAVCRLTRFFSDCFVMVSPSSQGEGSNQLI